MIRSRSITIKRSCVGLGVALLCLCGCVETSEFGRRRDSSLQPGVVDLVQPYRAIVTSSLTEDERVLRMRVFALMRSPRPPSLAGLMSIPDDLDRLIGPDPDLYFTTLAQSSDRSPYTRFRRLGEDVSSDIALIPSFRIIACRVREQDRFRMRAADEAPSLTPAERADLEMRKAENNALIEATEQALPRRVDAYHVALEHLVTASPDLEAQRVLRDLDRLKALLPVTGCTSHMLAGLVRKG